MDTAWGLCLPLSLRTPWKWLSPGRCPRACWLRRVPSPQSGALDTVPERVPLAYTPMALAEKIAGPGATLEGEREHVHGTLCEYQRCAGSQPRS